MRRVETTPAALRAFAPKLGPDDAVGLEATINTFAVARLLEEHAGRVVVSNPMRTRPGAQKDVSASALPC